MGSATSQPQRLLCLCPFGTISWRRSSADRPFHDACHLFPGGRLLWQEIVRPVPERRLSVLRQIVVCYNDYAYVSIAPFNPLCQLETTLSRQPDIHENQVRGGRLYEPPGPSTVNGLLQASVGESVRERLLERLTIDLTVFDYDNLEHFSGPR